MSKSNNKRSNQRKIQEQTSIPANIKDLVDQAVQELKATYENEIRKLRSQLNDAKQSQ